MEEVKYAFYSHAAAKAGCGTNIYRLMDGREVEVTCIWRDKDADEYLWEDKVCLGQVKEWVRLGQADRWKREPISWIRW